MVSPLANASWPKLVAEFLQAKEDPDQLRVFVNTMLAEPWREAGDEISDIALQTRAEPFGLDRIPPEVLAVTIGCDVQRDRLEMSIIGWTREGVALVLGHVVLWGQDRRRYPLGGM